MIAYEKALYEAYLIACVRALHRLAESGQSVGSRLLRGSQSDGHKLKTYIGTWQGSLTGCL